MSEKQWGRRQWLGLAAVGCAGGLVHCGGGGGADAASAASTTGNGTAAIGSSLGTWALRQSAVNRRQWETSGWQGGASITLSGVNAGATLVLCVWGYVGTGGAGFRTPADSQGQALVKAADTGLDSRLPVQSVAWVLHNANAGTHQWTNLPDFAFSGDGVAVLMEFTRGGTPSTTLLGAGTATVNDTSAPWFTSGSVTMSAGANTGDLLVACGFEEEATKGNTETRFSHAPADWRSVHVNNDSERNIAGEVCWRAAPDAQAQSVAWDWSVASGQDPSIFKGLIFAVR